MDVSIPVETLRSGVSRTVLAAVLDAYRSRRDQVQAQARAINRLVRESLDEVAPGNLAPDALETAAETIAQYFDPVNGGFGTPRYVPARSWASVNDTPAARTLTRTSPGPGTGASSSTTFKTSGPP